MAMFYVWVFIAKITIAQLTLLQLGYVNKYI